jgi:hypothetical protein
MLNQLEPYRQEQNPIQNLVDFEARVKRVDIESPIEVKLVDNGENIRFDYQGMSLTGKVDRPLMHQLGGRIWKTETTDFESIEKIWRYKFGGDKQGLEADIASAFRKYDLSIRYFKRNAVNNVYGIVSPSFVDVNQLHFRQRFLQEVRKSSILSPRSLGLKQLRTGEIIEQFVFESHGFQTEYQYGLKYAKNNGYDAYKVNWGRVVLICSNGLTSWAGQKYRWKHNKEIDLAEFITFTVNDGIRNQQWLEQKITDAREKELAESDVAELRDRLSLARASKDRVMSQLEAEARVVGKNEWALSQALTYLGTHEKALPIRNMHQLTNLGTDILERSLNSVLKDESRRYADGAYGLVLPKKLQAAA